MRGSYWLLDSPTDERAIDFTIEARADDVAQFARDKTWRIRGTLGAERLATRSDAEGTLAFKLLDERRLPYRLRFRGDDGRFYELSGQKEWLYDDAGEEIARATLRFDLRADWGLWMRSFRIHLFS